MGTRLPGLIPKAGSGTSQGTRHQRRDEFPVPITGGTIISGRQHELPVSLFAVPVYTVLLTDLSTSYHQGKQQAFEEVVTLERKVLRRLTQKP